MNHPEYNIPYSKIQSTPLTFKTAGIATSNQQDCRLPTNRVSPHPTPNTPNFIPTTRCQIPMTDTEDSRKFVPSAINMKR